MALTSTNATAASKMVADRQRISTPWLYTLLALGVMPFLLIFLRLLGLTGFGPTGLVNAGLWLNQHLSLLWVGFNDRDVVLYILLLPLAALLIAIARLTLGLRVLGFRSILIAIGMREIGVLPCLLLILLIAVTVILIRPSMRRSGMPLYARVAVVLCIVALTMLSALLAGAWLDSATLWSMAFFPVVILAMLAESIADTVARDGLAMALWRTGTTIALAVLIALLHQFTPLRELALACPELLLPPLVMVVLVSEFLDLRLFEGYRPFTKSQQATSTKPQIVLVRNRFPEAAPRRLPAEVPRRYRRASLQELIDQLRARAYDVKVLECDATLPERLRDLAKNAFAAHGNGLCVLNYSGGTQGVGRLSHVPVFCETLGIPHTGPAPDAAVLWPDRLKQLDALRAGGLHVPQLVSLQEAKKMLETAQGKLWVRPRFHSDRRAVRVADLKQLNTAMRRGVSRYGECMLETAPMGTAITVIVQNPEETEKAHALPVLERTAGRRPFKHGAQLDRDAEAAIIAHARRAARVLGCRDTTRIDLYYSTGGAITVTRVIAVEPLTSRSAAAVAAGHAGLSLVDIAEQAIFSALARASGQTNPQSNPSITANRSLIQAIRSKTACNTSVSSATA